MHQLAWDKTNTFLKEHFYLIFWTTPFEIQFPPLQSNLFALCDGPVGCTGQDSSCLLRATHFGLHRVLKSLKYVLFDMHDHSMTYGHSIQHLKGRASSGMMLICMLLLLLVVICTVPQIQWMQTTKQKSTWVEQPVHVHHSLTRTVCDHRGPGEQHV